jgi:endo-1,4-beta-xylanase
VAVPDDFYNLANSIWVKDSKTDLIKQAFRKADEECSGCTLILNEFGNEEMGTDHGNVEYPLGKADYFYDFVREMVQVEEIPIDGVGFQLHLDESKIVDLKKFLDNVDQNVKRYARLGLEVQFTELDIRIHTDDIDSSTKEGKLILDGRLSRQAEIYGGLMNIALSNSNVTAFMLFGFTDRYSAIADSNPGTGYAHIFDKDYNPKPAYYALLEELKKPHIKWKP